MERISLNQITEAVSGVINAPFDDEIADVCIDTRKITPGCLFIAIKGEHYDGHDFIEEAYAKGAVAVVSEKKYVTTKPLIHVIDTRQALLDLAAYYRRLFSIDVVGITGSVGKTSTKEMVYAVLASQYKTVKTKGNLNNEIGMPMTLFSLDNSYEAAVVEMGMSDYGEISRLSRTLKPTIGIITNIGISHIQNFGSMENILKAKLEILDGMDQDTPLILNKDDDLLCDYIEKEKYNEILSFGINNTTADVKASNIIHHNMSAEFDVHCFGQHIHVTIPVMGKHNVYNTLAAVCVGLVLKIPLNKICESFQNYQNAPLRQNIYENNGIKILEDCYNASPDSIQAALDVLQEIPCEGKRVAVLGDMLELGEYSEQAHRSVGKHVAEANIDLLICYGKEAMQIKESAIINGMVYAHYFESKNTLIDFIRQNIYKGDAILFKASRGIKLEEVLQEVFKEC